MANPRKFSEKIALHNQKQAEETAAFEQIMREVSDATAKVNALPKQHLLINQTLGTFRGGSLPNVNHIAGSGNTVDLKNALSSLEEMKGGIRVETPPNYTREGRSVGVGPMRTPPNKPRKDTSPYSGPYLSPPPDTTWTRSNSDSAINISLNRDPSHLSFGSQRRVIDSQRGTLNADHHSGRKQLGMSPDGRPRSCFDVPRVPGINIYPSQQEPGTIQIPIGNNTGSLPDLTSVHFPSPLHTPLDQEDHSSSPYSTSPQVLSPSTLSPTLSTSSRPHTGRFSYGSSPQESRGTSPSHSPSVGRRHYPQQNLIIGVPQSPTNHLSVPNSYTHVNSYTHTCKGVAHDTSNMPLENFPQQQYLYQQPQQSSPSQTMATQNQPLNSNSQANSYRDPNRPSPQTSPGLSVQGGVYRSGSPGDTSHSGPHSPVSPASSPGLGSNSNPFSDQNNYFISQAQNALQQHFEQFNMLDSPVSGSFITSQPSNNTIYTQAVNHGSPEDAANQGVNQDLATDYYGQSLSQLHYNRPVAMNPSGGSTQQTTPQTPNTPSSIPDIILTDFSSSAGDELTRQEFKDLGSAMSGSFDSDLFPSDETLREGLDPIDFDGLQMLTDPDINVITDPATEENFRLDRL